MQSRWRVALASGVFGVVLSTAAGPGPAVGVTVGTTGLGARVDVTGRLHDATYTCNGTTYNAAQVGSLSGQLKFGNRVKPYVGLLSLRL